MPPPPLTSPSVSLSVSVSSSACPWLSRTVPSQTPSTEGSSGSLPSSPQPNRTTANSTEVDGHQRQEHDGDRRGAVQLPHQTSSAAGAQSEGEPCSDHSQN